MPYPRRTRTYIATLLTLAAVAVALSQPNLEGDPRLRAASAIVVRLTPIADTWIEVPMTPGARGIPTVLPNATPRGSEPSLRAGWSHLSPDERALMRFAIPIVPPDSVLEEAVLALTLVDAAAHTYEGPPPVFGTMALFLAPVASAWDESSLTGAGSLPDFAPIEHRGDVAWGPCAGGRCGTAEVDVLPLVRRWAGAPEADHGLAIDARYAGQEASFGAYIVAASRESATAPELRLRYVPAGIDPTPTAISDLANLTGSAFFDCASRGVRLSVTNVGLAETGPFSVASSLGPRWEIDDLGHGEVRTIFDPGSRIRAYRIDADDVVRENDESDNVVDVAIPVCPAPTATRPGDALGRVWMPWARHGNF